MRILGIETSCDETSAGIVEKDPTSPKLTLLSNVIATSLALHAKTGGIIPEVAAREQVKYILPVIEEAVMSGVGSDITKDIPDIDAIAVTYGPGLIGSLLVGVETARTLAYLWNKPLMPINHLRQLDSATRNRFSCTCFSCVREPYRFTSSQKP
jgi:N6-L-threonylcarbamoyladenine synthase